jgi:hypothetical protein
MRFPTSHDEGKLNMTNPQITIRPDPKTLLRIKQLASIFGPVRPLTTSDVVRECVRRVHEAETSRTKQK